MDDDEKQEWEEHAEEMKQMRQRRRFQFREVIKNFRKMGFVVEEISPYQFRFNDVIDIYPSNKKFHDLKKGIRGDIRGKTYDQFLNEYFGLTNKNARTNY